MLRKDISIIVEADSVLTFLNKKHLSCAAISVRRSYYLYILCSAFTRNLANSTPLRIKITLLIGWVYVYDFFVGAFFMMKESKKTHPNSPHWVNFKRGLCYNVFGYKKIRATSTHAAELLGATRVFFSPWSHSGTENTSSGRAISIQYWHIGVQYWPFIFSLSSPN